MLYNPSLMQGVLNKTKKLYNDKGGNSGWWCFAVEVVQEGYPHLVMLAYQ